MRKQFAANVQKQKKNKGETVIRCRKAKQPENGTRDSWLSHFETYNRRCGGFAATGRPVGVVVG